MLERLIANLISTALFCCGVASAQATAPPAAFDAADVHVSPYTRFPFLRDPAITRNRYQIRFATMVDLIRTAYDVDAERVLGGPNWLENDLFDVTAKVPAGTNIETAKPMLQALLTDRFGLTFHNDTKPITAYALRVAKRSLLKEADDSGEPGCKFVQPPPASPGNAPVTMTFTFTCRNVTMAALGNALRTTIFFAGPYLNDRVVADQTGLKGAFDLDLKFSPKGRRISGPDGAVPATVTLFDALEKVGLKLEPAEVPLPVIMVDQVSRKPTPNAPNIAEVLKTTPVPTTFEVAEIKPTGPDSKGMMLDVKPGGRVNMRGVTLKFLIQQAWDVTDDMLVGAPKWFDTDQFDIVAKADMPGPEMQPEELFPMLQALIAERFQMKTHFESRPATAYTLLAVKPKLKKADPAERSKYKEGPALDGKDPRDKNPVLGRLVTCQNLTMGEFAEKLKNIAPGYIHSPVLDATGIEGGYDFTLSFSPAGAARRGGGRGGDGPPPAGDLAGAASDPNGAVTLFEAIEKQLGLKLQEQKRPVNVMVIDHVEQKPIEN